MTENEWVDSQTNKALTRQDDVEIACNFMRPKELPLHPDNNKNWDSFLAVHHTRRRCSFSEPILDAGAGDESAYLPGLRVQGFHNLIGINLDRNDDYKAGVRDGIRYAYGDITSTPFPNDIFQFISCLSVIEHGVDVPVFLTEVARILKPGGHLFVSFDYWVDKLDTLGLITHDAPLHIFSCQDVLRVIDVASVVGLRVDSGSVDTRCEEKIIAWAGLEYTFMNLLFRKEI
jgi:SAM-dependent methyltransferase